MVLPFFFFSVVKEKIFTVLLLLTFVQILLLCFRYLNAFS